MKTLTTAELAARWQMDRDFVSRLLTTGKGPGVKVGGKFFIPLSWVERFEQGEPGPWNTLTAPLEAAQPAPDPLADVSAGDLIRAAKLLTPVHTRA